MKSDDPRRNKETYFEGTLYSFDTPAIPVVPGMILEPRLGRPSDRRPQGAMNTENGDSLALPPADGSDTLLTLKFQVEQKHDGSWIADVPQLPGVIVYGQTRQEAVEKLKALALRVLADRFNNGQ